MARPFAPKYPFTQSVGTRPSGSLPAHSIEKRAFVERRSTTGPGVTRVTSMPGKRGPAWW